MTREILRKFRISNADPKIIQFLLIVLLIIILFVLFRYVLLVYLRKKRKEQKNWQLFYLKCKKQKLTHREVLFLERLIKRFKVKKPLLLLNSVHYFNKFVIRIGIILKEKKRKGKVTLNRIRNIKKKLGLQEVAQNDRIYSSLEFEKGEIVEFSTQDDTTEQSYNLEIVGINPKWLVLNLPLENAITGKLRPGNRVKIIYKREDDAEYILETTVYKKFKGKVSHIFLNHSTEIERIDLRKYARIDITLPVKYYFLSPEEEIFYRSKGEFQKNWDFSFKEGVMNNLSAGGFSFHISEKISSYSIVLVDFHIIGVSEYNLFGEVLVIKELENNLYEVLVEFLNISDEQREQLIHFIFDFERRKKAQKDD